MTFRPRTKEEHDLYKCAKFCNEASQSLLEFLPKNRDSQATLANFLEEKINKSGENFFISADFLIRQIRCTDSNLVKQWTGAPANLAWLMVHEQLSNYFCKFVADNWDVELYLIHHVPKSGGTSVCEAVHQQSCFVAYPHTNFNMMIQSTGLLGFGIQLAEFERKSHSDRIYAGGHFNLPDMLGRLGTGVRCRGISLTRSPADSTSSAIRYVWTMVEQDDPQWTHTYPSFDPARLSAVRRDATLSGDPVSLSAMRDIAHTIVQAPEFQENYVDLLSKYYYNHDVKNVFALQSLFSNYPELAPSVDAARDENLICWQLRIDGPVPHLNASLFSHRQLVRAFGNDDTFHAAIAPASPQSSEIYGALCVMRALSAQQP